MRKKILSCLSLFLISTSLLFARQSITDKTLSVNQRGTIINPFASGMGFFNFMLIIGACFMTGKFAVNLVQAVRDESEHPGENKIIKIVADFIIRIFLIIVLPGLIFGVWLGSVQGS